MDPSCSLHKATNHILCWIGTPQNDGSKIEAKQCGNNGSPCLDKPMLGRGGGGTPGVMGHGASEEGAWEVERAAAGRKWDAKEEEKGREWGGELRGGLERAGPGSAEERGGGAPLGAESKVEGLDHCPKAFDPRTMSQEGVWCAPLARVVQPLRALRGAGGSFSSVPQAETRGKGATGGGLGIDHQKGKGKEGL